MVRRPDAAEDVAALAERAYVFSYPLLLSHRAMCRPNRLFVRPGPGDTLRICGWLDLASGPRALSVDDTFGRYYVLWLRDAWNSVYASVGARSTGTGARAFAVLGPTRHGDRLRPPLSPIAAPTRFTRVSGCIEAGGATAIELAARIRVCDLSRWTRIESGTPLAPAEGDDEKPGPVAEVEAIEPESHFAEALRLAAENPTEPDDRPALDELRAVVARGDRGALAEGARRGREAICRADADAGGERAGAWRLDYDTGRYGRDYLRRAAVARAGRGGEPAPDELTAVTDADADGRPLSGRDRYLLRFAAQATPPAGAFWTLTTPAGSTGVLRGLSLDGDGSLPIRIQHDEPAAGHRGNWLPAPAGRFSVVLRLYWPSEQALDRQWLPPAASRMAVPTVLADQAAPASPER